MRQSNVCMLNACTLCKFVDQFDLSGINISTKNRRIASQSVEIKIKLKFEYNGMKDLVNVIDDCW